MAKISTYGIDASPNLNDKLIGTKVEDNNNTYNYTIADILSLVTVVGQFVPYVGATTDVDLGVNSLGTTGVITSNEFIKIGGTSSEFLKADGSVDSNVYLTAGDIGSTFVPYTGASSNVNLGTNTITANSIIKAGGTSAQFLKANGSVDSNTYLTTTNAGLTYIPYTGATTNVNLGTFSLTANSIIKVGGTSSQFLKADGSVDNNTYLTSASVSGTYVPYTGALSNVNLGSYNLTANTIVKAGGTATQFLKANGTVDSNTYLTTTNAGTTYVPYIGATSNVNLGLRKLIATNVTLDTLSSVGTTINTLYAGNVKGLGIDFGNQIYFLGDYNSLTSDNGISFVVDGVNEYAYTTHNNNPVGFVIDFNNDLYLLGDFAEINNGTYIAVSDGVNQTITTLHQGVNKGLSLNYTADEYQFGDITNNVLIIDNASNVIYTQHNANLIGLELYFPNREFILGDPNTIFNGTFLKVDDTNQRIEISKALYTSSSTGTVGQILVSQGAGIAPQWTSPAVLYSATFFDTTTQNNGGATVANQVLINSTQAANGFTLGPNNRINVTNAGTYFFSTSMQLAFTGGASNYNVTVWYTINDVIVPNSAFTFTTTGAQNDQTLAVITDTIALTAGQYLKFYWWSAATGMKLLATAAGTSPTRPLSPSVNVSIFNVS